MANRKYRHNANVVRTSINVNGDLNGLEDLFMFTVEMSEALNGNPRLHIVDLIGALNTSTDAFENEVGQFNYAIRREGSDVITYFNHDGTRIDNINAPFANASVLKDIDTGDMDETNDDVQAGEVTEVYIKGQFNTLAYFPSVSQGPSWGSNVANAGEGFIDDEYEVIIKQWGKSNTIKNWNKFCEDSNSNYIFIECKDEPKFDDSYCYKAFKGSSEIFSQKAVDSINTWDTDKMTRLGRMFEGIEITVNIDNWTMNGPVASTDYMFYMRNSSNWITNKGANMVPKGLVGWAGYAAESFSDSFQGTTGIHNWDNVNTSQCIDMQYFAWQNTRSKSLGTMRNLITSKVENFTAMFGHAGTDAQGAEGELLIDPSNWDMNSAKTCFYMFGIESPNFSSWNGELNWKTMRNCIDIHSIVKNRTSYTGPRLDEFAQYSGNVVLFRSAFARTAINYDFSNWNFSGVDATRTDVSFNENNSSGIMGGFVRDCANMSLENTVKLLEACDRPFGQGGLPVSGVDPQIGTSVPNTFDFGTSYADNDLFGWYDAEKAADPTLMTRGAAARASLISKGYDVTGLDFLV